MTIIGCDTLTVAEVADRLGISLKHCRDLERTDRLPFASIRLGDRVVFPRAAVDAVLGRPAHLGLLLAEVERQRAELGAVAEVLAACSIHTAEALGIVAGGQRRLDALRAKLSAVRDITADTARPAANGTGSDTAAPASVPQEVVSGAWNDADEREQDDGRQTVGAGRATSVLRQPAHRPHQRRAGEPASLRTRLHAGVGGDLDGGADLLRAAPPKEEGRGSRERSRGRDR